MDTGRRSDALRLAVLVLAVTVLRALAAVRFPMVASEAYYWVWARHPALGYFDHPPMVAWIGAAFGGWVTGSTLAARAGPLLLGGLSIVLVHRLAREIWSGDGTAWRAAVLFAVAPVFFAFGAVLLPDTGLLLFCLLAWILFLRAARRPESLLRWALAGAAAGGALLSKFHAFALLPPLYGYLIFAPAHRRILRTSGPWLALAVALFLFAPNILWNSLHDFATFGFQSERSGLGAPAFRAKNVLGYFGGPLLSLSPLVFAAVVSALVRGWRHRREPETLFLLLAGAPILLFFAILCPLVSIGLHWPAVGFVPLLLLVARGFERGEILTPWLRRFAVPVSGAMVLLLLAAPEAARLLPSGARLPLFGDKAKAGRLKEALVEWSALGQSLAAVVSRESADRYPMTMTDDFHLASLLAFYAEAPNRTFVVRERKSHQYGLWLADRPDLAGKDALVVLRVEEKDGFALDPAEVARVREAFVDFAPGPRLPVPLPGGGHARWALQVLFAHGFRALAH